MDGKKYIAPLKKKFSDAIAKLNELSLEEKDKMYCQIEQFINPQSCEECVT